jgi:hypothetical protein
MPSQAHELNREIMNQATESLRNGALVDSSRNQGCRFRTAVMLSIILVAILAGVIASYSTLVPIALAAPSQGHAYPMQQVTVTASQSVSLSMTATAPFTQSMTTVQSSSGDASQTATTAQASTSVTIAQPTTSSVTTQTMTTTSQVGQYCGYGCDPYNQYPPYYPGYPGYYGGYPSYPAYANAYGVCGYGIGYGANVQCTGYIYQAPTGCTELVIQVVNPYSYTSALQYYTLHNLSSTPPSGTLVTVQGQMYQGLNTSSTGAACPGNYINVSSISTA